MRRAGPGDADALGVVGPAAYAEAYGYLWDEPAGYAAVLAEYGRAAFAASLAREDEATWLAERDGRAVGFLRLALGSPDPVRGLARGAEVRNLYLLGPARARGLGRRLLGPARDHAAAAGAAYLWLDAMVSAPWAWGAYERWGFRRIGGKELARPVRAGAAAMHVLALDL